MYNTVLSFNTGANKLYTEINDSAVSLFLCLLNVSFAGEDADFCLAHVGLATALYHVYSHAQEIHI